MFRFRLQRVLELRAQAEQQAAIRLAAARDEAAAAHATRAALESLRDDGARRLGVVGGASTAGQLQNQSYMIAHIDLQIQHAHSVALAADENVQRLLAEFTAAFQDRRVLDRLRDRQHDEWKAVSAQADRQRMDDIALSRYVRQPSSSATAE